MVPLIANRHTVKLFCQLFLGHLCFCIAFCLSVTLLCKLQVASLWVLQAASVKHQVAFWFCIASYYTFQNMLVNHQVWIFWPNINDRETTWKAIHIAHMKPLLKLNRRAQSRYIRSIHIHLPILLFEDRIPHTFNIFEFLSKHQMCLLCPPNVVKVHHCNPTG